MTITIRANGFIIPYDDSIFPGGEVHVRLKKLDLVHLSPIVIEAKLTSSTEIFKLLLITDAVKRQYPIAEIDLVCPYVSYARQDRVCNEGESLSIKVMCDLINSQNYRSVEIWDPHSDVTPALINRCKIVSQWSFTQSISLSRSFLDVVAPDKGASKKAQKTADYINAPLYVCDKIRTGRDQMSIHVPDNLIHSKNDVLIVDDICDGGMTFIKIAEQIKKHHDFRKIYLYVTHGIFSKGIDPLLLAGIEQIYCANIWPGHNRHQLTHLTR